MAGNKAGWGCNPTKEQRDAVARNRAKSTSSWFEAVERGEETRMKQLLAAGQDVNAQDTQCSWPAIYMAAWKNRLWQAELLLASGADVALQSGEGDTAVHIAARYGHAAMLQLLLRSKVVDVKNEFGKTPLDVAKQKCNWECVGVLQKALGLQLSKEVTNPPPPLPKNWLEGDYGNGAKFYYNPFTGDTLEKRPAPEYVTAK